MSSRLVVRHAQSAPRAAVLVLHGGQEHSHSTVSRFAPPVLRMIPIARSITAADDGHLVVARLIHSERGWNGEQQSPVPEARDALQQLRSALPGLPLGVVGHSMGGRTAMRVAGEEAVSAVVGLAPWLPEGEPVEQLAGRRVLIAHGRRDRTTSPELSRCFAERAAGVARSVSYVSIARESHAMLRRYGLWESLAAGFLAGALLGLTPEQAVPRTENGPVPNLLRRIADGAAWLEA